MIGKCSNCETFSELQEHHIVPRSLGGTDNLGNKVWLCEECHGLIHDRKNMKISHLTYKAKEELSKQGKFAGGNIAYGYDYDKEAKEFSINEHEEAIVCRIFSDYIGGKSANKIATELNNERITTKRKGIWQAKQVLAILNNRFYTGQLEWEGIINKGTHEAIISERQFNKVQKMLEA